MRRRDLEHVLRAAGAITGISDWVIVGSQAILGRHPDAPPELLEEIRERLGEIDRDLAALLLSRANSLESRVG